MTKLSRALMASRDLIRNTAEAQRMSLLMDKILLWQVQRNNRISDDEHRRVSEEIDFLRGAGLVGVVGVNYPHGDITFGLVDGTEWDPVKEAKDQCDILFPMRFVEWSKQQGIADDVDRVVVAAARALVYEDAPVIAHVTPNKLYRDDQASDAAIGCVVKKIPVPAEPLPWDDFIQFRADAENQAMLRELRLWIQQRATSTETVKVMEEELEALLHRYRRYMEIQKIKYGDGKLSVVVAAAQEILANLASLNLGAAVTSVFEIRKQKIALAEAEMLAPGREVSYIARIADHFEPN